MLTMKDLLQIPKIKPLTPEHGSGHGRYDAWDHVGKESFKRPPSAVATTPVDSERVTLFFFKLRRVVFGKPAAEVAGGWRTDPVVVSGSVPGGGRGVCGRPAQGTSGSGLPLRRSEHPPAVLVSAPHDYTAFTSIIKKRGRGRRRLHARPQIDRPISCKT